MGVKTWVQDKTRRFDSTSATSNAGADLNSDTALASSNPPLSYVNNPSPITDTDTKRRDSKSEDGAKVDVDVEKLDSESREDDDDVYDVDSSRAKTELTPMESMNWDVSGDMSPFPEVQACVSTEDDVSLEVNSAWIYIFPSVTRK